MASERRLRRWTRDARLDRVTIALVIVFAAARVAATADRRVAVLYDSESYFRFRIWGGVRFPVVTALYSVVGDHGTLAVIQVALGVLAWATASVVAGSVLDHRGARYGFQVALLALGLTLPVTGYDDALQSESIATSLTVLLVALVLRYACRPTTTTAFVVFVVASTWGLTRPNNAMLLVVVAIALVVIGSSRADRRLTRILAAGLLAVSVVGVLMAMSTSKIRAYNTAQIVVRRVLPNDARYQWFLDHNMPRTGRALAVPPYENRYDDPAVELEWDPTFGFWLREHSQRTYLVYLATHPGFTLTRPFSDDGALRALARGIDIGTSRRVLPDVVENVFWPQTDGGQFVVAMGAVGIVVATGVTAVRSRPRRRAFAGAGGVLLIAVGNVVLVTHTAGYEYERLLVPSAVATRMALMWLLAVLIGGVGVAAAGDAPERAS